jgi:signal peptidase I
MANRRRLWWNVKSKSAPSPEGKVSVKQAILREALAWFWVGLAFLLINGTIGQARVIPSGSMENTLLVGDHVLMSRIGYDAGIPFTNVHVSLWRNPQRQELIVFHPPVKGHPPDWVKRVIGLPGDTVDIHDDAVWINGKRLQENYTLGQTLRVDSTKVRLPYKVPPDCYFVMGDNRENSYDSRYVGCVPRKNIIGIPVMIYMSIDAPEEAWNSPGIRDRLYAYANALLHPSEIRWRRLFHTF